MNVMIFNRKIEVIFTKEDELILDGQSKICNWLYNYLLEMTIKDYKENNNDKKLLAGRNLRNQVPILKQEFVFLNSVHSSPLKNTAIRLKESYKKFFNNETEYPKFKSWKKHWFSLYYDEPNKGFKLIETETGKSYYLPSKRWTKLNNALDNAYHKRREQIKSSCYSIVNWIAKNYDYVAIGDYTPSLNTATQDNMHRSMLNQEIIGEFRNILKWVMERSGKHYSKVDEKDTIKTCCICGNKEKKDKLLSGSDYVDWNLYNSTYTAKWNFKKSKILFTDHTLEKSNIWMN